MSDSNVYMNMIDDTYVSIVDACMISENPVVTRNAKVNRICGCQVTFNSTPLVSIRKTSWKSALREMEWFLSGSNNINDLHPSVRDWWKPWAVDEGKVKYNYSKQLRHCTSADAPSVDQVDKLIKGIKEHPFSRRNVITTWHGAEMNAEDCPITNCHMTLVQAFVDANKQQLNFLVYQRSADVICGLPHNWIQFWAFHLWVAKRTGFEVGSFSWIGGDCHVYEQHFDIVKEMVELYSNYGKEEDSFETPQLIYNPTSEEFKADDFSLDREYKPLITTKAEMVV